jgi:hypothetical protein
MKQRPAGRPSSSEKIIRNIKSKTRKQCAAEEKIRIVLDGVREVRIFRAVRTKLGFKSGFDLGSIRLLIVSD